MANQFPVLFAGQRITAALLNQMIALKVVKPTDESLASSATLQNDNDLVLPLVANATYLLQMQLGYEGGTAGASDLKIGWTFPTGTTIRWMAIGNSTTPTFGSAVGKSESTVVGFATNGAGVLQSLFVSGEVTVSSTAGNLQLQWAQNTINATATIVHAQSWIRLERNS